MRKVQIVYLHGVSYMQDLWKVAIVRRPLSIYFENVLAPPRFGIHLLVTRLDKQSSVSQSTRALFVAYASRRVDSLPEYRMNILADRFRITWVQPNASEYNFGTSSR